MLADVNSTLCTNPITIITENNVLQWTEEHLGIRPKRPREKAPMKKKTGGQNQETQKDIRHLTEEQKGIRQFPHD